MGNRDIMIVDDAAFMRMMLKDILVNNGFEVSSEVSSGEEALERYPRFKEEVVLMDITMEGIDGIETTKRLLESYPECKVIMCSAIGQQDMVLEAIRAGAKDFIVKPFQADRVVEAVKKVLD